MKKSYVMPVKIFYLFYILKNPYSTLFLICTFLASDIIHWFLYCMSVSRQLFPFWFCLHCFKRHSLFFLLFCKGCFLLFSFSPVISVFGDLLVSFRKLFFFLFKRHQIRSEPPNYFSLLLLHSYFIFCLRICNSVPT